MKSISRFLEDGKHQELNPLFWTSRKKLQPKVRTGLLKIAEHWADWTEIPAGAIEDIHLVGGNAGYFYNKDSDLDLHLIVDKSKISDCEKLLTDYLRAKKKIWAFEQDVQIYDADVEVYAEDIDDPKPTGQGRYSVLKNKWITEPTKEIPTIDDGAIQSKFDYWKDEIDDVMDDEVSNVAHLNWLKEKLMKLRKQSLKKGGEYAIGNLVYKLLRKEGYLDKLDRYMKGIIDNNLSLYKD